MTGIPQILVAWAFLVVNALIMLAVLWLNRQEAARARADKPSESTQQISAAQDLEGGPDGSETDRAAEPASDTPGEERPLKSSDILGWEFEYARTTASEAMQDRHTMVNFYLLVTGALVSGVVAVMTRQTDLPRAVGTVLLWLLTGIGWLYFLKIIRLRQAWHDSARTMNQIKKFYFQHANEFAPDVLREAFRWKPETLPAPDKRWTVFFYSAMLIAFLDSVAYVGGGALLDFDATTSTPLGVLGSLSLFGLLFFGLHVWLYSAFLRPESRRPPSFQLPPATESARSEQDQSE